MLAHKIALKQLPVESVRSNRENPRLHFPEGELDDLARSIDEVGVLVPISVYAGSKSGQYVLIDGERRWRCASHLGLKTIPAIVMPKPDSIQNLKTMFNIHLVREEWDDMPTAWALHKLIDRVGDSDDKDLAAITGLSVLRIKQLRFALTLPKDYQGLIDEGRIPLNFFFELDRHVIQPLAKQRPGIVSRHSPSAIRDAFVKKRLNGVSTDTVELRNVRPIINVAEQEAGGPAGSSDLDDVIDKLIADDTMSIQEAYENTVEMVVETGKFVRQCELLLARYDRLMTKSHTPDEVKMVKSSLRQLASGINSRLAGKSSAN
jgi:ParB family chromosome partitioning protein